MSGPGDLRDREGFGLAKVPCQGNGAATLEHTVIGRKSIGRHALEVSL